MTELSPTAKPVWDAYEELLEYECVVTRTDMKALAAALRAAADQVVPDAANYLRAAINSVDWWDAHDQIRAELLAIAAELENANV